MANETITISQPPAVSLTHRNLQLTSLVIYCVIFSVGTVGNGLVIYVTSFRMRKTVNSVWFLNLAVADFLFTASLIFSIIKISQDNHWQFGRIICKLNSFVSVVNMFASIFLLTAISLDRCLCIWAVVWAQNQRTAHKAQLICAVIWVAAMVCSAPFATFRELFPTDEKILCFFDVSETQLPILTIFRFVVGFLIPFLVIFFCCAAIGVRASRLQRTRTQRPHRLIISVILAFFLCWLPIHIVSFIELDPKLSNIVSIGGPLAAGLAYMNSCLNPILYVFMCDEFQKKLKQSVCLVLESALGEDHMYSSSRTLSSHFSRIPQKSDSSAPVDRRGTEASLN